MPPGSAGALAPSGDRCSPYRARGDRGYGDRLGRGRGGFLGDGQEGGEEGSGGRASFDDVDDGGDGG